MFRLFSLFRKKSTNVVADESLQTSGSRRSVSVPDTPAATNNKDEDKPWRNRLLGYFMPQKANQSVVASQNNKTTKTKKAKKPRWWRCCKKRCRVAASVTPQQDEVVQFKGLTEKEERQLGVDETVYHNLSKGKNSVSPSKSIVQEKEKTVLQAVSEKKGEDAVISSKTHRQEKEKTVLQAVSEKKGEDTVISSETHRQEKEKTVLQAVPKKKNPPTKTVRQQQIRHLGFPNPAQFCYINSCLQSLLTLKDFVRTISCQEQIWSLFPDAALVRSFMAIKGSHSSGDANLKNRLLSSFRKAIWSPEFHDLQQKDAHEFLVSILDQMRCLSPQLQVMATSMGTTYSCPVEQHMVFKMLNTRTCKRCGAKSSREEEFTNLSLNLVPGGGTVEDMLQEYMTEKELEYNCECGATTSVQRSSFLTLPRVLVLHLKRFRMTPSFMMTKVHDPIVLLRDLVVFTGQDGALYSLVSSINHISPTPRRGHYVCDGVDPDIGQEDPTDRWFTYNDSVVTETSGDAVCNRREKTSYILFYKRQD